MKPTEYILGYMLLIIPIILIQNILFFILAIILGLSFRINIIWKIGDVFAKICKYLHFESCVTILKVIMNNNLESITTRNIAIFVVVIITILVISVIIFKKKMISDNK